MTIDEAIAWFEHRKSGAAMPGARRMYDMAIDALQEQVQREQGCEYCRDSDCLEAWLEMKDRYCRHCGRKLDGGGAHDEL